MTSQLPYIQCVSCGTQIGHLYADFYYVSAVLEKSHDLLLTETKDNIENKKNDRSFLLNFQLKSNPDRNVWTDYLETYYVWLSDPDNEKYRGVHTPKSLILESLLTRRSKLSEDSLPLNSSSPYAVRFCCKSAFLCDNSRAPY